MPVQDVYSPNYSQTNFGDQASDFWAGTNKVAQKDMLNALEQQKATSLNKYEWNKQGMLAAGINPIMNASSLGSSDAAPVSNSSRGTPGQKLLKDLVGKASKKALKNMDDDDAKDYVKTIMK